MRKQTLDNEQKMLVMRMHAEGSDSGQIRREVKLKYDIDASLDVIKAVLVAKKHQPYIKQFKDTYLATVREVPIANKRFRLDDVEKVRKKLLQLLDKNPLKTKSDKTEFLQVTAELRRLLDTAREEMERKPQLISNVVMNMGDMSDDQLHKRKTDLIRRLRTFDGRRTSGAYSDRGSSGSEDIE